MKAWHGLAVGVLAVAAIATPSVVYLAQARDSCVRYDVGAELCGNAKEIAVQFEAQGVTWVGRMQLHNESPVPLCIERARAQADMNDWPEEYQMAFERGCREGWNR